MIRVDADLELVIPDDGVVEEMWDLAVANLERLRQWEPWAHDTTHGRFTNFYESRRHGTDSTGLQLVILEHDRAVGSVGALIDVDDRSASVGYWLGAGAEGRGIATRSVAALCDELTLRRGIERLWLTTSVGNLRSRRLAHRVGFSYVRTLPAHLVVGEAAHDCAYYERISQ